MAKALVMANVEMSLAQLGEFVQLETRKAATSVWKIGHALTIAKEKAGHGKFGPWLKSYFPQSQETANRLMALATRFTFEQIEDKKASEAFKMLKAKAKTKATTPPVEAPTGAPLATATDNRSESQRAVEGPTMETVGLPDEWESKIEKIMASSPGWLVRLDSCVLDLAEELGLVTMARTKIVTVLVNAMRKAA